MRWLRGIWAWLRASASHLRAHPAHLVIVLCALGVGAIAGIPAGGTSGSPSGRAAGGGPRTWQRHARQV